MSLPSGWEKHVSKSTGREYYLNIHTKQSQWDPPTEASSKQVRCSHLLVKHKDSRRPASWREENITRTKDEAVDILLG
jgi:NIMA-interacting peptidyl-prolyl cis-trans isomerase 1